MNTNLRPRVAVIFGGQSSEHTISCATAAGVLTAIDRTKYDVVPIGITQAGQWLLVADDAERLSLTDGNVPEVTLADGTEIALGLGETERNLVVVENGKADSQIDVVLPLLHGPFGEDGTIQGLFELADLPYVGSGVLASAVAMDKHYMKVVLESAGLPVGPYVVITDRQWTQDPHAALDRAGQLQFPVFVKPCRAGSSIGISKVTHSSGLSAAIEAARVHDPKVIIETGIEGREIEVAVLEGRAGAEPRTTQPGEIVVRPGHDFYTYEAKYFDTGGADLIWPADLPEDIISEAQSLAAISFEALSCEGLARADLFYGSDDTLYVNEVNTMPGFTPFSMYPLMWMRSGMEYHELITELIELALARRRGLR